MLTVFAFWCIMYLDLTSCFSRHSFYFLFSSSVHLVFPSPRSPFLALYPNGLFSLWQHGWNCFSLRMRHGLCNQTLFFHCVHRAQWQSLTVGNACYWCKSLYYQVKFNVKLMSGATVLARLLCLPFGHKWNKKYWANPMFVFYYHLKLWPVTILVHHL